MSVSLISLIASLIFAETMVGIFTPRGSAVYEMAVRGYRIFSIGFLFLGVNGFSSAMFTALNDGKVSAILSFFRTLVFISAAALTLPFIIGLDGVWLAMPLAEVLGVCMTVYYFKKMKKVYQYA